MRFSFLKILRLLMSLTPRPSVSTSVSATVPSHSQLGAQLAKQQASFKANRGSHGDWEIGRKRESAVKRMARENRDRSNAGVALRAARDQRTDVIDAELDRKQRIDKKVKRYNELKAGKTAGLSDAQIEALNVDFDASMDSDDDSADDDRDPKRLRYTEDAEPNEARGGRLITVLDDVGRFREVREEDALRVDIQRYREWQEEQSAQVHQPIYTAEVNVNAIQTLSADQQQARIEQIREREGFDGRLTDRYDAAKDNRARGAAFGGFRGTDEEERARKEQEQRADAAETARMRAQHQSDLAKYGKLEPVASTSSALTVPAVTAPVTIAREKALDERRKKLAELRAARDARR